jgi:hypothetical protein
VSRLILLFAVSLFVVSCGSEDIGGDNGGGAGGSATCTYGGTNYPVGQCIPSNGAWMKCSADGEWKSMQMGGGGARPPGC